MLGNRIQRARKALGLSLRELAEQVGLSHAAIKKYEDNQVTPTSEILIKLAKALHIKVEYFFRPERFDLADINYRKDACMSDKCLDEISAKIIDQVERRCELESLFPSSPIQKFQQFSFKEKKLTSYDVIEEIADNIRRQWNLGSESLSDLIDIFEEHGIKVFEIDNQKYPQFDGLFANINNNNEMPIIVIGNQWPGDRQRFTLAHELGHIALYGFFHSGLDEEKCCNRFAGAFLLPKQTLINILGEHRNFIEPRELSLLKQEFGISMTAILHRAEDIGIITKAVYRILRKEFDDRGWTKHEPGAQYPREKTYIFEQMIFRALAEEYISESKAAELMNMSLDSFRTIRAMEQQDADLYQ